MLSSLIAAFALVATQDPMAGRGLAAVEAADRDATAAEYAAAIEEAAQATSEGAARRYATVTSACEVLNVYADGQRSLLSASARDFATYAEHIVVLENLPSSTGTPAGDAWRLRSLEMAQRLVEQAEDDMEYNRMVKEDIASAIAVVCD